MQNGNVVAIFIAPQAGAPMQEVAEAEALAGKGLKGDRYAQGEGSFNKDNPGNRQVTLVNSIFFKDSGFEYAESRRNIITEGVELMKLIGKEFHIGNVIMRGVKYCSPCKRPNLLLGKETVFKEAFFDRGGLVAEIIEGGIIKKGDDIIPPAKNSIAVISS